MKFENLALSPSILQAISDKGYTVATPIQSQAIPAILEGRDLLGIAQTGTGKTAAFSIPTIQNLCEMREKGDWGKGIKVLIITPTRELAIQIDENFAAYGKGAHIKHCVIFGGVKQESQVRRLKAGMDVLIATPGRLLDLMNQRIVNLSELKVLILDEADRMLDMGFINDVKKIIAKVPNERQSLFFSATMPPAITTLVKHLLRNPVKVEVAPASTTAERVTQKVYFVDKGNKKPLLIHVLQELKKPATLVFTRTKHGANKICEFINKAGIASEAIHGNKSQSARQNALKNFKDGRTRVLVATDIAARGIDIKDLPFVINYELPNEPESYVHRIGRTGRAEKSGTAISFCDKEERAYLKDIQKLINKTIPEVEVHPYIFGTPVSADPDAPKVQAVRTPKNFAKKKEAIQKAKPLSSYPSTALKNAAGVSVPRSGAFTLASATPRGADAVPKKKYYDKPLRPHAPSAAARPTSRFGAKKRDDERPGYGKSGAKKFGTKRPSADKPVKKYAASDADSKKPVKKYATEKPDAKKSNKKKKPFKKKY